MFAVKYLGNPLFFWSLFGMDMVYQLESYFQKRVIKKEVTEAIIKSLKK